MNTNENGNDSGVSIPQKLDQGQDDNVKPENVAEAARTLTPPARAVVRPKAGPPVHEGHADVHADARALEKERKKDKPF